MKPTSVFDAANWFACTLNAAAAFFFNFAQLIFLILEKRASIYRFDHTPGQYSGSFDAIYVFYNETVSMDLKDPAFVWALLIAVHLCTFFNPDFNRVGKDNLVNKQPSFLNQY